MNNRVKIGKGYFLEGFIFRCLCGQFTETYGKDIELKSEGNEEDAQFPIRKRLVRHMMFKNHRGVFERCDHQLIEH